MCTLPPINLCVCSIMGCYYSLMLALFMAALCSSTGCPCSALIRNSDNSFTVGQHNSVFCAALRCGSLKEFYFTANGSRLTNTSGTYTITHGYFIEYEFFELNYLVVIQCHVIPSQTSCPPVNSSPKTFYPREGECGILVGGEGGGGGN